MFELFAAPAINRLLRANTWALEKLSPHAGKCARLTSAGLELNFIVTDTGEIAPAALDHPPDVTIAASPGVLLRLAAEDDTAWRSAEVSGDVGFAEAIEYVRRHLVWDYEEDLSVLFGDIAAHRIAGAVRELDRFGRKAAFSVAQAFTEYAVHERPMLVDAETVDRFNREVDEVRDHAARLEKRIELLRRQLGPGPS